ncbi:DUF5047 domain-containing protein [Amycolatopsis sp. 195334CR]|uniref:DUF5047 domain-containing protein n=1 Tax=Amycolatopsis sp. 195334CR TaxID=2814588 RepID=UPI001A8E5D92|nr:DUF5047 domain-containing protein [Amycolatopsis sp. 195334CR]MBN6037482.1 DUF5047 domain-containing protein [Amycolatopsis sp. 195334CR]
MSPVGTELALVAGDVKLDSTAAVRGTTSLTVLGDFPATPSGLLTPYGREVYVERGIDYGDGTREFVGQGYFRLTEVDQADAPRGEIRLSGADRMSAVVEADVLAPFQFGTGASVGAVFDLLVGEVLPGVLIDYDFPAATTFFNAPHVVEKSRFDFLQDICDSLGKVMYFDYRGRLQVRTAPDPAEPVFLVNHGERGVLTSLSRRLSRTGVYNAVVATGEQAGEMPPVRGVAVDENPFSPTYWNGPFGKVPRFYSSSFLTTTEQCTSAAKAMLERASGLPYNVDFSMVPNPALEPLDPVQVTHADTDNAELHVLETLTIPLTAGGAMTATTREKLIGAPA